MKKLIATFLLQEVRKCMGIMCIQRPALVPASQFPSSDRSLFQAEDLLTSEGIKKLLAIRRDYENCYCRFIWAY